jgi:hypothetical protein
MKLNKTILKKRAAFYTSGKEEDMPTTTTERPHIQSTTIHRAPGGYRHDRWTLWTTLSTGIRIGAPKAYPSRIAAARAIALHETQIAQDIIEGRI